MDLLERPAKRSSIIRIDFSVLSAGDVISPRRSVSETDCVMKLMEILVSFIRDIVRQFSLCREQLMFVVASHAEHRASCCVVFLREHSVPICKQRTPMLHNGKRKTKMASYVDVQVRYCEPEREQHVRMTRATRHDTDPDEDGGSIHSRVFVKQTRFLSHPSRDELSVLMAQDFPEAPLAWIFDQGQVSLQLNF